MDYGIVSNCWRTQLAAGTALEELIAAAQRQGYDYVELRQGCLGACEEASDGAPLPVAGALLRLRRSFPDLRFNVAIALPFFRSPGENTPLFEAGLEGALAAGGPGAAHLRLVDTASPAEAARESDVAAVAEQLAVLAAECAERNALLSVENARQPWRILRRAFAAARDRLGDRAAALRLCYDPCNLLGAADHPDPLAETQRLGADEIALFHLKQSCAGEACPEVGPGEIDWPAQLAALRRIGYEGPRLFEIPPGPDIWDRLERSRRYLNVVEEM